jgi:hypothetical protein
MAKKYAFTKDVPAFDEKAAYNSDRPISSLIRTQLLHLATAENLALSPKLRTGININTLHTEREAAEYIQRVTASLHKHGKAEARNAVISGYSKPARKSRKPAKTSRKPAKTSRKKRRTSAAGIRKRRPPAKTRKSRT